MNNFLACSTVELLSRLSCELGINLFVKRDDLLPMPGGGSKVRKLAPIIEEMKKTGADALVTTGGLQSNHARTAALYAAKNGWRATLVLHHDSNKAVRNCGNLRLMRLAGATIFVVTPARVRDTMNEAVNKLTTAGHRPFAIPGGGHSLIGALAYKEAAYELEAQWCASSFGPLDYVVLASGTGSTQAGLVAGLQEMGWRTKVIGVSIARPNPRGSRLTLESYTELVDSLDMERRSELIDFRDEWVGPGYQKAEMNVLESIRYAAELEGLILDPTYTGKAFTALRDLVKCKEVKEGSNVLFWHTGGIMNLMASDYFYDVEK